jgi:hypothetical protein
MGLGLRGHGSRLQTECNVRDGSRPIFRFGDLFIARSRNVFRSVRKWGANPVRDRQPAWLMGCAMIGCVIDTIFINGTVGSGKTSSAEALSALEAAAEHPHAVIDADDVRRLWPAPDGDPFQQELELQNLRGLAENYRAAGAAHLIVAGVIERAGDVARYAAALGSTSTGAARMLLCRLTAEPRVLEARLHARHDDEAVRDWHLHRAGELAGILAVADFDDLVLDSTVKTPRQIAHRIAIAAGWAPAT